MREDKNDPQVQEQTCLQITWRTHPCPTGRTHPCPATNNGCVLGPSWSCRSQGVSFQARPLPHPFHFLRVSVFMATLSAHNPSFPIFFLPLNLISSTLLFNFISSPWMLVFHLLLPPLSLGSHPASIVRSPPTPSLQGSFFQLLIAVLSERCSHTTLPPLQAALLTPHPLSALPPELSQICSEHLAGDAEDSTEACR